MNPKRALEILEAATAQLEANRSTHQLIAEAINCLKASINTEKPVPTAPGPVDAVTKKPDSVTPPSPTA